MVERPQRSRAFFADFLFTQKKASRVWGDPPQSFEYDVFGQLTQTSTYHEPSVTPVTHEVFQYSTDSTPWPDLEQHYTLYKYDAAGRRMQVNGGKLHNLQRNYAEAVQIYTYAWQEAIEPHDTQYRYNGEAIYLSYKTGNSIANPNARWLQGAGVDEPLIRYGNDGSMTNYHQDGRNSVAVTTRVSNGSTVAKQSFDAFGNKVQGSGNIHQYGFTGREPDASGLMYYRARYYDSQRGRFLQRDPKGMIDGINQYAYVRNNPVNRIDPNGTVSIGTNNFSSLNNNYFSSGGSTGQSLFNTNNSFDAVATAEVTRSVGGDTGFIDALTQSSRNVLNTVSGIAGAVSDVAVAATLVCPQCAVATGPVVLMATGIEIGADLLQRKFSDARKTGGEELVGLFVEKGIRRLPIIRLIPDKYQDDVVNQIKSAGETLYNLFDRANSYDSD